VLEAMPRKRVASNPELSLAFAAARLALEDKEAAEPFLRAADGAPERVAPARRARVAAATAAVELYGARLYGDPGAALATARDLLEREGVLDEQATTPGLRAFVLAQLGIVELWAGDLDAAVEHLERSRSVTTQDGGEQTVLTATAHLALANLLRGEFARARRRADDALAIADRGGWTRTDPAAVAYCVLASLAIERDELDDAQRLLTLAGAGARLTRERPLRALHALSRVVVLADRGEHAAALDLLRATRGQLGDWPVPVPLHDLVTAREGLLLAATGAPDAGRAVLERGPAGSLPIANATATLDLLEGEPGAARAALASHLEPNGASHEDACPARAEAWLLDALALDGVADHAQAARSLERALDLSEPGVLRRIVVGQGAAAGSLLRRHVRYETAHPEMVAEAIDALERRRAAQRRAPTALAEPLSEREQAILRYLPTTMSNQEIAGELFVSVNTVKTHLKAIYRKLDVPGRREAVDHARALGLMP
jgi:LuxR family maltose regulon positive regulatory protein